MEVSGGPAGGFALQVRTSADCHVLELSGELDVSTVNHLRRAVDELISRGAKAMVVDATGLAFMDSAGLGALVVAQRKMRVLRGAVAVVVGSGGPVERVIVLTGLHHVLRLFRTVEEAVDSLGAPADGDRGGSGETL